MERAKTRLLEAVMEINLGHSDRGAELVAEAIKEMCGVASLNEQTSNIMIDKDFVGTVQKTARVLLRSAADLQNAIRFIERECPYSNDNILKIGILKIQRVAGDCAEIWDELDLNLEAYDMPEVTV
jgi:hypothetical protein